VTIRTAFEAQLVPASLECLDLLGEVDPLATTRAAVEARWVNGSGRDVLSGWKGGDVTRQYTTRHSGQCVMICNASR